MRSNQVVEVHLHTLGMADDATASSLSKMSEAAAARLGGDRSREYLVREAGHDPHAVALLDDWTAMDLAHEEALERQYPGALRSLAVAELREAGVPGLTAPAEGFEQPVLELSPEQVLREAGIPAPARPGTQRMREATAETPSSLSGGDEPDTEDCGVCDGAGVFQGVVCPHCSGSGQEPNTGRQRISSDSVVGDKHAEPPTRSDDPHSLSNPLGEADRAAFRQAMREAAPGELPSWIRA